MWAEFQDQPSVTPAIASRTHSGGHADLPWFLRLCLSSARQTCPSRFLCSQGMGKLAAAGDLWNLVICDCRILPLEAAKLMLSLKLFVTDVCERVWLCISLEIILNFIVIARSMCYSTAIIVLCGFIIPGISFSSFLTGCFHSQTNKQNLKYLFLVQIFAQVFVCFPCSSYSCELHERCFWIATKSK